LTHTLNDAFAEYADVYNHHPSDRDVLFSFAQTEAGQRALDALWVGSRPLQLRESYRAVNPRGEALRVYGFPAPTRDSSFSSVTYVVTDDSRRVLNWRTISDLGENVISIGRVGYDSGQLSEPWFGWQGDSFSLREGYLCKDAKKHRRYGVSASEFKQVDEELEELDPAVVNVGGGGRGIPQKPGAGARTRTDCGKGSSR